MLGGEKHEKRPKLVTAAYLERAALHYLGRFNSTHANLKAVLERKVRRRNEGSMAPSTEQLGWICEVADKCVKYGYVNDEQYARQRFESLLRKGKPLRTIAQDLRYKGVPGEIAEAVMAQAQQDPEKDLDLVAAAAYARRRRFGPFRRADRLNDEKIEKEKASMMRAGFPYALVTRIMEASEDELLSLLP